jgi:hypothetical protein
LDMTRSSLALALAVVFGAFVGLPSRSFADARAVSDLNRSMPNMRGPS